MLFHRTFSPAAELDGDLLVHVLAQVENIFLLGPLALAACPSTLGAAATTASSATVASSASATAPECASLRHVVWVEWMRGGFGTGEAGSDVQLSGPVKLAGGLCPAVSHQTSRHHVSYAANTGVEEAHFRRVASRLRRFGRLMLDDIDGRRVVRHFRSPPPNEEDADPASVLSLRPRIHTVRHPRGPWGTSGAGLLAQTGSKLAQRAGWWVSVCLPAGLWLSTGASAESDSSAMPGPRLAAPLD